MIKKAFNILFSIFLIYQSWGLLTGIVDQEFLDHPLMAFLFSFFISLFITGVFAFAGFALPTQKLLPEKYYSIKNKERLEKCYKSIRVGVFRKYLLKFFWGKPEKKKEYFRGGRSGIGDFITNTKKSEFGHLIPFVLILAVTVYVFVSGKIYLAIGLLFFNILGNFYPIILQRYHRARLERIGLFKKKD